MDNKDKILKVLKSKFIGVRADNMEVVDVSIDSKDYFLLHIKPLSRHDMYNPILIMDLYDVEHGIEKYYGVRIRFKIADDEFLDAIKCFLIGREFWENDILNRVTKVYWYYTTLFVEFRPVGIGHNLLRWYHLKLQVRERFGITAFIIRETPKE
jgi:hypothetical protein